MVHQLRVDVRDDPLPLERLGIETPEGQDDSRGDGSGPKAAGNSLVLAMAAAENGDWR
jgi:hypothetical protein